MFSCKRCGYATLVKGNLKTHYLRKKSCGPIISDAPIKQLLDELAYSVSTSVSTNPKSVSTSVSTNPKSVSTDVSTDELIKIIECQYCKKTFKHRQSKFTHENKHCKFKNNSNIAYTKNKQLTEKQDPYKLIEKLQDEKETMASQIYELIGKVGNNTTNIQNQQNIHIHLNGFGDENLEYINNEYLKSLLKGPFGAIPKLLKNIHFHPDHPENWNIKINNKKLSYINVYDGKEEKWKLQDKRELIKNIVNKSYNILDNHFDEIDTIVLENFKNFQDKYDNNDKQLHKTLEKDTELVILNNCD